MESGLLGKKVFFLYPPPVLSEIVEDLARQEFEVYLTREHDKLRRYLDKSPDSIVFINLDDGLEEAGWLSYVESLRKSAPSVGVGIVTLNDNAELREHYLMNLQVQCGFVILKIGAAKTGEILAKTLEANEARGRRKFVRAACAPGVGQCAFDFEGATIRAELTDLSSAGMAIHLEGGLSLKVGTVLRDIAVTIKGGRLSLSGVVVAKRSDDGAVPAHVVMFDPASLDEARREKLKSLVCKVNQISMDAILSRS
jgi:PilZ domain.